MYALEAPPPRMTPEIYYRRFQAHFPSKRAHIDTRGLQVGQEVSFKGFSAFLIKFVPSELDPDSTCVICMEEVGDAPTGSDNALVSRTCGHVFHRRCLQLWRHRTHDWVSKRASCPTCRASVREGDIVLPFDQWEIAFSDGSTRTVPTAAIKTPKPTATPFNPRHRNDLLSKEKNGDYDYLSPAPKRPRNSPL